MKTPTRAATVHKLKRRLKAVNEQRRLAVQIRQLQLTRRLARSIWDSVTEKDKRTAIKLLTNVAAVELNDKGIQFLCVPWFPGTLYRDLPMLLESVHKIVPGRPYIIFAIPTTDTGEYNGTSPYLYLHHGNLRRRGKDIAIQVLRNVFGERFGWPNPRSTKDMTITW